MAHSLVTLSFGLKWAKKTLRGGRMDAKNRKSSSASQGGWKSRLSFISSSFSPALEELQQTIGDLDDYDAEEDEKLQESRPSSEWNTLDDLAAAATQQEPTEEQVALDVSMDTTASTAVDTVIIDYGPPPPLPEGKPVNRTSAKVATRTSSFVEMVTPSASEGEEEEDTAKRQSSTKAQTMPSRTSSFVELSTLVSEEEEEAKPRKTTAVDLPDGTKVETVAQFAGWTAKRVSITGEIFFEHDADGRKQSEIPHIPTAPLVEEEYDDMDTDVEDGDFYSVRSRPAAASSVSTTSSFLLLAAAVNAPLVKEKPEALTLEMITKIKKTEGNSRCCDCGVSHPVWCSFAYGVLVCLPCSGYHRNLGTHITVVKCLDLDNFTPTQYQYMIQGGNARFKSKATEGRQFARYKTDLAEEYRADLKSLVEPQLAESLQRVKTKQKLLESNSNNNNLVNKLAVAEAKREARESTACMVCGKDFTVRVRKVLCRNCNKACCAQCAPPLNSKPLPQLGLGTKPQRHCQRCYRSPFIDWSQQGLSAIDGRKSMTARKSLHMTAKTKAKLVAAAVAVNNNAPSHVPSSAEAVAANDTQSDSEVASQSLGGRRKTIGNALGKLILRG